VEYQPDVDAPWRESESPRLRQVAMPTIAPHWLYQAALTGLKPGSIFTYQVRKGGNVVFSAEGRATSIASQPFRFVAFGDDGSTLTVRQLTAEGQELDRFVVSK
jgi:hypothetical protein